MENVKQDISELSQEILAFKQDIKRFELKLDRGFDRLIRWIVGTGIGVVLLTYILIKVFIVS